MLLGKLLHAEVMKAGGPNATAKLGMGVALAAAAGLALLQVTRHDSLRS